MKLQPHPSEQPTPNSYPIVETPPEPRHEEESPPSELKLVPPWVQEPQWSDQSNEVGRSQTQKGENVGAENQTDNGVTHISVALNRFAETATWNAENNQCSTSTSNSEKSANVTTKESFRSFFEEELKESATLTTADPPSIAIKATGGLPS